MQAKIKAFLKEKILDQEAIIQLRQRFNELNVQTQSYIIIGGFSAFLLLLASTIGFAFFQSQSLKTQIADTDVLLMNLQQTAMKMDQIRQQERESRLVDPIFRDIDPSVGPQQFVEKALQKSKIGRASADSIEEKGNKVDVKLSKISLKQLVRLLYYVEHSNAGASVEKLKVETRDDPEGYLWSSFTLNKESG